MPVELRPIAIAVQGKPCIGVEGLQLFRSRFGNIHLFARRQASPLRTSVKPSGHTPCMEHELLAFQLNDTLRFAGRCLHGKLRPDASRLTETGFHTLQDFCGIGGLRRHRRRKRHSQQQPDDKFIPSTHYLNIFPDIAPTIRYRQKRLRAAYCLGPVLRHWLSPAGP